MHEPLSDAGGTGLRVSVLGFGGACIGFAPTPDAPAFVRLLQRARTLGINFIDTSPDYRDSEALLGRAFLGRRADLVLATKVGHVQRRATTGAGVVSEVWTQAGVVRTIEASLRRLRTDYLDLVQLHSPPLWVLEDGQAPAGLERAQAQGKVRLIGISADGLEACRALAMGRFATLQISYSMLHQEPGDELRDLAVVRRLGLIIKQPVVNGLTDRTEPPAARVGRSTKSPLTIAAVLRNIGAPRFWNAPTDTLARHELLRRRSAREGHLQSDRVIGPMRHPQSPVICPATAPP